ncbi:TetR family transcriptional regulator C-terminal domain-containing protein [Amycolatopsis sp. NPDC051758]|uniref:LmrA/YxaF family transcription factor n=1 Tax=Amycolatopsis sp. NPDC051758 TaxID=3363935 RepID=UPI0037A4763D
MLLAVIEWQAERVLTFHRSERFTHFGSLDSLREWADHYIAYERSYQAGCSLGSLAGEIIKTDLDVRTELANAFQQWRDIFRNGLERMQGLDRLGAEADPTRLAHLLLSAFQGGMLLAQVARDIAPLKDACRPSTTYRHSRRSPLPTHPKIGSRRGRRSTFMGRDLLAADHPERSRTQPGVRTMTTSGSGTHGSRCNRSASSPRVNQPMAGTSLAGRLAAAGSTRQNYAA